MRRSIRVPLLLLLLVALPSAASVVLAQPAFVDVSDDHWAGDAVERIADLGIVIGHPDGSFRGDEAFTRYQAALVVSRLLDVIDLNAGATDAFTGDDIAALRAAVARLGGELDALETRVGALETGVGGATDGPRVTELERRIETLSAEIERLREALAEVGQAPGPVGPRGPDPAPGAKGPEGPGGPEGRAGPAGAPGDGVAGPAPSSGRSAAADAGPRGEPATPRASDAADGRPGGEPAASRPARRPAYLGFAAASESNDRVPLRMIVGYDRLLGPIGLRATIDVGRQSPIATRAVTVAAHLTYARPFGDGRVHGYLGAGGGYQVDAADGGQAAEGAFAGVLAGLEVGLVGPTSAFFEGMVDAYVNEPPGASDRAYGRLYPTVAAGIAVRF